MILSTQEHGRATEPWVVEFLCACVNLIGAKRILEIGVLRGQTTVRLLGCLPPDGSYTAIDPQPQAEFEALLDDRRLVLIRAKSNPALEQLTQQFDFIFVDGDHSFAATQYDIDHAVRLLRPGGILAVHDALSTKEPSVGLAVRLHLPQAICLDPVHLPWEGPLGLALYSRPHFVMNIQLDEH